VDGPKGHGQRTHADDRTGTRGAHINFNLVEFTSDHSNSISSRQ